MKSSVFIILLVSYLATGVVAFAEEDDKAFLEMLNKRADELINESSKAKVPAEKKADPAPLKIAMVKKLTPARPKIRLAKKTRNIASVERQYIPAIYKAERQDPPAIFKAPYSKPSSTPIASKMALNKTEDPLILGLKQKIQNNSTELRKEQAYLEKAYTEVLIPLSRELANVNARILEKESMGQEITQQDKDLRIEAERRIQTLRDQLQSTRDKVKKLEEEQKELSTTLYQYFLVSS